MHFKRTLVRGFSTVYGMYKSEDSLLVKVKNRTEIILTHRFELPNKLLLGPLGPLLFVCVDGAQDRSAWFPTVLYGRHV